MIWLPRAQPQKFYAPKHVTAAYKRKARSRIIACHRRWDRRRKASTNGLTYAQETRRYVELSLLWDNLDHVRAGLYGPLDYPKLCDWRRYLVSQIKFFNDLSVIYG